MADERSDLLTALYHVYPDAAILMNRETAHKPGGTLPFPYAFSLRPNAHLRTSASELTSPPDRPFR